MARRQPHKVSKHSAPLVDRRQDDMPSHPVPYNVAIHRMSFNYMKAVFLADYKWMNECVYGLSFMYNKPIERVEQDLVTSADIHAEALCKAQGIPLYSMGKLV